MLVITPFRKGLTAYKNLSDKIIEAGKLTDHTLHVVTTSEDEAEATVFAQDLSDQFGRVTVQTLKEADRPPIQLANDFFRAAARFIYRYAPLADEIPNPPMLYLDPTYRPVRNGWVNALQASFYLKQKHSFGSFEVDGEGAQIPVGPIILSKEFVAKSGLIDSLGGSAHWRSILKWEFSRSFEYSKLIGTGKDAVISPLKKKA